MAKYKVYFTIKDKYGKTKEVEGGIIDLDVGFTDLDQKEASYLEAALPLENYLKKSEIYTELAEYATDLEVSEAVSANTLAINTEASRAVQEEKQLAKLIQNNLETITRLAEGTVQDNTVAIKTLQNIVESGGSLEVRVAASEKDISQIHSDTKNLKAITKGFTGDKAIQTAINSVQTVANQGVVAARSAQLAATTAQKDIDKLIIRIEDTTSDLAELETITNKNISNIDALEAKSDLAKIRLDSIQQIVTGANSNELLRKAISELQSITVAGNNSNSQLRNDLEDMTASANEQISISNQVLKETQNQVETNTNDITDIKSNYIRFEEKGLFIDEDVIIFNCGTASEVIDISI